MASVQVIPTTVGDARATVHEAASDPWVVLVLGHGAGGGIQAADLAALARRLPEQGITVVRVEQPWRVAGRKVASRPPRLDVAWREVISALRARTELGLSPYVAADEREVRSDGSGVPLIVGGRSAGARVACRTARETGAVGVLALAFPLHPPGRPDRSRAEELLGAGVPTLVIQGERDSFGRPTEFPPGSYELIPVPAADHGLSVPRNVPITRADVLDLIVRTTGEWLDRMVN
jgi:predicted alpha/beta-hydrolase family hydrolase